MKKLLPPQLLYISMALGIAGNWLFPIIDIIYFPYNLFGIVPLIFGLLISIAGSNLFEKIGTNIKTFNKPDKLVTEGPFKYSRNPMYLGFVIFLFGISTLLGSLLPFIITIIYFIISNLWYIPFEEKAMALEFGDLYLSYKDKTGRWI